MGRSPTGCPAARWVRYNHVKNECGLDLYRKIYGTSTKISSIGGTAVTTRLINIIGLLSIHLLRAQNTGHTSEISDGDE